MKGTLLDPRHLVGPSTGPGLSVQNAKSLRCTVDGEMYARQGSMIAFRGDLQFERQGQGVSGMLKRAVTGEGLPLMSVRGRGEAWFAHRAQNCFVLDLEPGDGFTANGRNILCFDPGLSYEIRTVKGAGISGGGLFNSLFTGTGRLGLCCDGDPLVIPVTPGESLCVDVDAVVGWTTGLTTSLHRSQSFGSMLRGGSGEAVQLRLDGEGLVVVRPSEVDHQAVKQG